MFKKIICLGVMLVMVFSLVACKNPERHHEKPRVVGSYKLEYAYENGWLSKTDLKNIAYYHNGVSNKNFISKPKDPEMLSKEVENKIKQMYLEKLKEMDPEATLDNVWIEKYYGTYSDCVVVNVKDDRIYIDPPMLKDRRIGGVLFRKYWSLNRVWILD